MRDRREYYLANKEKIIRKVAEWQKANPERHRESHLRGQRSRRKTAPYMNSIYAAKMRCKKDGALFDLDRDWAEKRWTGRCELTNLEFDIAPGKTTQFSVSIDRIDPKGSYTQNNCRFVLWAVNRFKSNFSDEIMMQIARALVGH